jgi:decaprenylphospho-beta-D-erythro-pentofuranosid-2-ulose 2-reductase
MENAFGQAQTIVLLGGTSDIGLAIVRRLLTPTTRNVVLACRRPDAVAEVAEELAASGVAVDVVAFDAAEHRSHVELISDLAERHGDLDVVIAAFGVLGDQTMFDLDPLSAAEAVDVNFTGVVSSCLAVAQRFRDQGHGRLIVLSSVAGERVRKANFVYGASKAGVDAFAQGLGDSLSGSGASVLVVRPGFVHSAMTAGRPATPFSSTPDRVAEATFAGLEKGRRTVWVPPMLRLVFMVFRHLPGPVWRRLPLG